MIIRSQCKNKIANLDNIDSIVMKYNEIRAYNGLQDSCILLGEYITQTKALKVLDMICEHYQNCEMCKCGLRQVAETDFVFQMPQDSEV